MTADCIPWRFGQLVHPSEHGTEDLTVKLLSKQEFDLLTRLRSLHGVFS
jgi:hypothetical protein